MARDPMANITNETNCDLWWTDDQGNPPHHTPSVPGQPQSLDVTEAIDHWTVTCGTISFPVPAREGVYYSPELQCGFIEIHVYPGPVAPVRLYRGIQRVINP